MKNGFINYLALVVLLPLLGACSMGQMIARSTVSILDGSIEALNRETDLELAAAAIPGNLMLIEGLIAEDPHNVDLLSYAAQGFYGYAFGFVELVDSKRAEALYARGTAYGMRALRTFGVDIDLGNATLEQIDQAVAGLGNKAVPALFWTASCWAKQIDLNRSDPARLAELSSTERLMNRVMTLQADFYYGGPHIYYGVYYGSRAPMFGGDFAKSEENFSGANAVTDNRLLIIDVLQAEYLERQRLDQQRFHELLSRVVNTPVGSYPEMELVNQIARVRARHLLELEMEWF